MASLVQNNAKRGILAGEIDMNADDIRIRLVMTNTTCDTENNISTLSGFTTIDACDATGYADVALTSEAVNQDNSNNRAEFDAADASFTGLGGDATRDYQGVLLYKFVTNDTDSIPIAFIEFTNQPITSAASQVDIPWNAEGILQLA